MTCVVGLVHAERVYIGVDSSSVQGWTRRITALRKVFRTGPFLIGYTGSFRMGQLLEHHLQVPEKLPEQSDQAYMVAQFIEQVRRLLKEKGFTKIESNTETGGHFLVGYRGHLYSVHNDFQVGEMADGMDAIGSGGDYALGAMAALPHLAPVARLRKALQIAAQFNMGVFPPFHVRSARR